MLHHESKTAVRRFLFVVEHREIESRRGEQLPTIMLRPRVSWDRAFLLYSTMGNNGKGTLISVLRNLVGAGNWC